MTDTPIVVRHARPRVSILSTKINMTQCCESAHQQHQKRKNELPPSFFDRLLKRVRTEKQFDTVNNNSNIQYKMASAARSNSADAATEPTVSKGGKSNKSSLEKARKREIKARLNAEASREIRPLAVGTVAMMASALANQALPKLLGKLLDEKTSTSCSTNSTTSASSALAVVVIGGGIASFLRTTMLNRAQDNIAKRLRTKLFGSVLVERDMEWFVSGCGGQGENADGDEESDRKKEVDGPEKAKKNDNGITTSSAMSPGAIGAILTEDINRASESVTVTFANVLRGCSSCTFATYHMLTLNPTLFGISVSVVPVVGAAAVVLNKFVKKATAKQRECAEAAAAFAEERLCHIETVKLANREADEVEEYNRLQEECVQLGRRVSAAKGTFMGFMFAATGGALYMVFNAGGRAIADGRMTSGELTSFATYSFLLGLGTSGVFKALGESSQGLVCADRVYKLMDGPMDAKQSDKQASASSESAETDSVQSISMENVCFSYRSSPDKLVLDNVSLSLERGKVVAIVGKNGSGKTTMASLIAGLYTPQGGKITIQPTGQTFHELNRRSQTALVQVVPQHPALFDTSIKENLVYASPDASDDSIQRALTLANCNDFISKLEGGLHFRVGRNGMRLSGGQRQRLALARALLSDPCLLILDEPTSALDAEGEEAVMDAVNACRSGEDGGATRGLLLITHRASTLKVADRIVVLKGGQVVSQGTFEELTRSKDSELCELMAELA
ncbi:hypothetical protein HJC23_002898 [Cyclotella cryptica]|uniref:ABC transporter n=1 Tax=Cyclotella cryptica TaxID=29204 RepID=A0ABD3PIN2_9STRA|eukprot:CCRYP_014127-RA/>CCRYP_014127-RA protein AED:0.06 eAED:0.06 QI:61/1/1/1/1/1/3/33/735